MRKRLRSRRGIFVVLFGLLFMTLMGAAAMAIDMTRIWTMRNELQTAAEAGALAGAVQLVDPHDKTYVADTAAVFIGLNTAMQDAITVDSIQIGHWDDVTQTFTKNGAPNNAVHTVVSHNTTKLIMGALGIAAPKVKARATAWADAPVDEDTCIRPWSIPYVILMSKVNAKRIAIGETLPGGTDPNHEDNLTRDFTNRDREVLNTMTEAERTFSLKMGAGNGNQTQIEDPPPGTDMPGNFQAVRLPRYRDKDGNLEPDGPVQSGADPYRDNIAGVNCNRLSPGDVLLTQGGNLIGPTIQGIERTGNEDHYVCYRLQSDGDCENEDGTVGKDIKAAFHLCYTGCNGMSQVTVMMLGSFTFMRIVPQGGAPDPDAPPGMITGIFKPITGSGPIGTGMTTLNRIILVRCEFRVDDGTTTACRY